jgi:hypothetical protein
LLGVLLLAVLGAQRTAALLARIAGRSLAPYLRRPATVLLLAPLLVPSASFVATHWGSPPDPRFRIYGEVGRFLRERSEPGDVVATTEIGVVGYESRRPILDLVGLVSPEVLRARRDGGLAELLAAAAPRYVVDVPKFARYTKPLLGLGAAAPRYRRIERFTTPEYDEPVDLLERLPAPR